MKRANRSLSQLDGHQIQLYTFDQDQEAIRVSIVNSDVDAIKASSNGSSEIKTIEVPPAGCRLAIAVACLWRPCKGQRTKSNNGEFARKRSPKGF